VATSTRATSETPVVLELNVVRIEVRHGGAPEALALMLDVLT